MIRFGGRAGESGEKQIVGLALGRENLERLTSGQPIVIDGDSVGAPGVVVIVVYGETSEAVVRELTTVARETGATLRDLDEALSEAGFDRRGPAR